MALIWGAWPAASDAAEACATGSFLFQVDKLPDWKALRDFYAGKPGCPDDGVFAEAYSDVVLRNLTEHWTELADLQTLAAHDTEFREFVLKHVDARATPGKLRKALYNATTSCPASAGTLCKEIAERASAALRELSPH